MAQAPRGEPRSVPDPHGDAYDAMVLRQRVLNARASGSAEEKAIPRSGSVGHPGFAESLIPVWGAGREAIADYEDGDLLGAGLNGALALSDLFVAGEIAKGLAKGGFYVAKAGLKKAPYAWKSEVRPWMGERGFLEGGQHGHHWAIPQNGWGKNVPDAIKNQPWNIKPMPNPEVHGRIHGRYSGKPQYNAAQRYWYGTPAWSKVGTGSALGHPALAVREARDEEHRGAHGPA